MDSTSLVVGLVVGSAVGAGVAWLLFRLRGQKGESAATYEIARLSERLARLPELEAVIVKREEQLEQTQAEFIELSKTIAELQTRLEGERKAAAEKVAALTNLRESFQDSFKALSADALKHNNQSFLELATQNLSKFQEAAKHELEKREKAVDEIVKPIRETLEKVDVRIENIEKIRVSTYATLAEQIKGLSESEAQLRSETKNLVKALASPNVRGRWGEVQLKRVVEMAGMVSCCDFIEQDSIDTDEGRLRPDLVVKLPNQRKIVVDSKTPLDAYLAAVEAPTEEIRLLKVREHAQHVRSHLNQLAAKNYAEKYQPGIDFVVLFLPGEVFYNSALEHDPELIEYGFQRRVLIATPPSLIGLLKVVAYGWRQEKLEENARQISELGAQLHDRVRVLANHFEDIRKGLDKTVDAYNNTVRSLESRVLVSARRLKELGAANAGAEIASVDAIDKTARAVSVEVLKSEEPAQSALPFDPILSIADTSTE
ncbi:MAG: DNA recombination protein RmuC [Bdellovibrionota bacterium]